MIDETLMNKFREITEAHNSGDRDKAKNLLSEYSVLLEGKHSPLTKEEIKRKIEKEIESEDVVFYITPEDERMPLGYAIIKGDYHRMLAHNTDDRKNIAIRTDQKEGEEWTRDSVINQFVDTIYDGLRDGRFAPSEIWFQTTEVYSELLKEATK